MINCPQCHRKLAIAESDRSVVEHVIACEQCVTDARPRTAAIAGNRMVIGIHPLIWLKCMRCDNYTPGILSDKASLWCPDCMRKG